MAPVVQHTGGGGGGGASTAAAAVAGSKQQARPFHKRTAVRLIIGALVCLSLLGFILFTPGSHDADWWKHAGIKAGPRDKATTVGNPVMYGDDGVVFNNANQPTLQQQQPKADSVLAHDEKNNKATAAVVARTPSPPGPKVFQPLVAGRDYYADYNIDTIKLDPEPPMAPGRKPLFNYVEPSLHPEYAMKYVSNAPRILVIQNFLSPEECDAIIATASKSLFRSQVAPTINSKDSAVQDVRTSSQAWLHAGSEPARPIVERIIKLAGFPPGSNEELQVLKYDLSQKYDAHNDYFDPKMYGPQATNRALTTFLYLSDVEEGGETQFPRADGKPPTFDFTSCTKGFRVRPKRGMAVMFYDMKPNGELDPYSLHGGCPVKKGVKWGGTLWLRMPTPKS